ncbi:hypothetical protein Esti_005495 [Eimeria stiedai]
MTGWRSESCTDDSAVLRKNLFPRWRIGIVEVIFAKTSLDHLEFLDFGSDSEEPPSFVEGSVGAPGAAGGPHARSLGKLELEQSYSLEDEAEGGLSPSLVSVQKNKKNTRKRPRVRRTRPKAEPAEATAAPESAAAAAEGVGSSLNSGLVAPPPSAPVYASPFHPQQAALLPQAAVAAPLPPAAGPPSIGDQGQVPFSEAVPGAQQPPFVMQQGYCVQQQGLGWLPGKTQEGPGLPQGPLSGGGAPVGPLGEEPPTEGEVKALIAFLTKRPTSSLKLAPCLMEEVERVWWQAKQQQQQQQGGGGEQLQQQLSCSASDQVATQGSETQPALGPPPGSLQGLSAGVPLSLETPEEARPPAAAAAAAAATVVGAAAAAAAACNPVAFGTAEPFGPPPENAGAAPAQQPPPVRLCVSANDDCSLPFQPLQQHDLRQQQLGSQQLQGLHRQQQLQGLHGQQQLQQLQQQQLQQQQLPPLQQQQQQLSQLQQQPQQLPPLQQQQQQLPPLQQQPQQLPQQQDCHEGPTLSFDEASMLQLDTSPKLLVGDGGGPSGPPASAGGPPTDSPPLSWLSA